MTQDPQTVDDIPWGDPPQPRVETATPRKCKHPQRVTRLIATEPEPVWAEACARCDHVFDRERQAKGRRVNNLAKDIERWVGRLLRLTRVGQYGGQEDLGKSGEWAFVQVKSGPAWFSEKQYREIAALPQQAGRRRALVTVEKPGSGKPRRALWVEILEEVPLPAVAGIRWESGDDGHPRCVNCGVAFPGHAPSCVHVVAP